jgi:hypothetical protein
MSQPKRRRLEFCFIDCKIVCIYYFQVVEIQERKIIIVCT